ncbi:hypothetical protein EDD86DRAFT_260086 [Gorgonomyces haynaldii]|nr:hypothetical protein EDD86DRAFT_260086 [Gorgonomyces haynaldii]
MPPNFVFCLLMLSCPVLLVYHLVQSTSVMLIVPYMPSQLLVVSKDWVAFVNPYWCAFDTIMTLFCYTCCLNMMFIYSYVPFAIFFSVFYGYKMPLLQLDTKRALPVAGALLFGMPLLVIVVFFSLASRLPLEEQHQLNDWHCAVNFVYCQDFIYFQCVLIFIIGILSSFMSFGAAILMLRIHKNAKQCRAMQSPISGDLVIRSMFMYAK